MATLAVPVIAEETLSFRVTVSGEIIDTTLSPQQQFDKSGGSFRVKAANGSIFSFLIDKETQYIIEGRNSRATNSRLTNQNILAGMNVLVRGVRVDATTARASLIIIKNPAKDTSLNVSGVIQSVGANTLTLLQTDGKTRTITLNNDTEVNVSYQVFGLSALTFVGKNVSIVLNPQDLTVARVVRIYATQSPRDMELSTVGR